MPQHLDGIIMPHLMGLQCYAADASSDEFTEWKKLEVVSPLTDSHCLFLDRVYWSNDFICFNKRLTLFQPLSRNHFSHPGVVLFIF